MARWCSGWSVHFGRLEFKLLIESYQDYLKIAFTAFLLGVYIEKIVREKASLFACNVLEKNTQQDTSRLVWWTEGRTNQFIPSM